MLKVAPWKGVMRFGKRGKLNPRYIGPFQIIERIGPVAYRLELPQELSRVHNVFHVCNLKKYVSKDTLVIPLEEIYLDDKLNFVEEPVEIMDREVKQLKRSRIPIVKIRWNTLDLPKGKRAIGTKWIFRNKKDERGIVIRKKVRLVAQGYTQEEGIDYDEVFAPVARIKAIRLFLAYASFMGFMVYQMDVKSTFLYGQIEKEVHVCQPPGFEDPDYPDKVYKVVKALYGLHQAPRGWYETLAKYLLDNGFHRGKIDQTLFIKKQKGDILLVQVYVDDIIFGSTKELCLEFEKLMHDKFQMSSIGELTFFLGLQVKKKEDGIFISQDKYVTDILKKFSFQDVRTASHPWIQKIPCSRIQMCKKQTVVATSSTEAEYVAAASCCGQVLWIQIGLWIPQSSGPPKKVSDEAVHKELGDRMERAATTASSLEAEQDSGNINRTQSMATLNEKSP
ncbi:putative ribonuclease H-like domain-containing protein [Tanacetum coccineum]